MREVVTRKYVAYDGTEFYSINECRNHESLLRDEAEKKIRLIGVQESENVGEWASFSPFASEDCVYAVRIRNHEDVEVVNNWVHTFADAAEDCHISDAEIGTIQLFSFWNNDIVYKWGTPDDLKRYLSDGVDLLINELTR